MNPVLAGLSRTERRQAILWLEQQNKKYGKDLVQIEKSEWPARSDVVAPDQVWRSCEFVVQVYKTPLAVRISVNRTHIDPATLEWVDNVTWDDLQGIKSGIGYGAAEAVEIYPPDQDVVNVANMRHIWVLLDGTRMPFSWRKS